MPIRHGCVISYRHGQHRLMRQFVEEFHEALASELEPLTDLQIYRDTLRLEAASFTTMLSLAACAKARA